MKSRLGRPDAAPPTRTPMFGLPETMGLMQVPVLP